MSLTLRIAAAPAVLVAASTFLAPLAIGQGLTATEKDKIGLTALINRLGAAAPNGAGIAVTQVEAPLTQFGNDYRPDPLQFPGDTIIPKTPSGTLSTHALAVGLAWYGSGGASPGVSQVEVWNANSWQTDVLRLGSRFAPTTDTKRVANFSWFGNFASTDDAENALARLDLLAERDNVVMVVSTNNGSGTSMPQFPASMYNGITVGLSSGASSKGPTLINPGRSKPDIVAPASINSLATPWVSGAAAILLQAAGSNANASQATTVKAVLLAGATKNEFDLNGSTATTFDDWSHTSTQPLDQRYGAGELNIDNSHRILTSGEQAASDTVGVGLTGWDYGTASPSDLQQYFFTVPAGHVAQMVSIIATWERHIDFTIGPIGGEGTLTPSLANIDLTLSKAQGFTVGSTIAESLSTVDNVEHIYLNGQQQGNFLMPGQYAISVPTDELWNYSLAWDVQLAKFGDANGDGVVDGVDYTRWADHFMQTGATFNQGDFNGDGVVDGADYTAWADNFNPLSAAASMSVATVPEPSGLTLSGLGLALLTLFCCGRRMIRHSVRSRLKPDATA